MSRHAGVQLLGAAERVAVPWKNRGGLTSEIAVQPPGATLENFDWRISCAQVDSAGAFSRFPGIDRIIVLLEGEMSLEVEGRTTVLSPESAPFSFPGDVATSGTPLAGTVRDLNVMTRRGHTTATLQRCLVEEPVKFSFTAATTVVLVSAEMVMKSAAGSLALAPLDAVRIDAPHECQFSSIVPGACFYRIEISTRA